MKKNFQFILILLIILLNTTFIKSVLAFGSTPVITPKTAAVDTTSYTHYENIPKIYENSFILLSPDNKNISYSKEVVIKGKNKFLTPVFINGEPVELFPDGRFYSKQILEKKGANLFVITFTTPQFQPIHIVRNITLCDPESVDLKRYGKDSAMIVSYLHSSFMSPKRTISSLSDQFTRSDLAFFICQLKKINPTLSSVFLFKDIDNTYWATPYIQYTVAQNMMTEYPDGNFYPDKPVKKIEYIITLIKALHYPLPTMNVTLNIPYQDVKPTHWTARYIHTAVENSLIPVTKTLNFDKDLTFGEFIRLALQLNEVKMVLNKSEVPTPTISASLEKEINTKIFPILQKASKNYLDQQKIELESPQDRSFSTTPIILFNGTIHPAGNFTINKNTYQSDANGHFIVPVEASATVNNFIIQSSVGVATKSVSTFYLRPYDDMEEHWLAPVSAKTKYLKLTEDTPSFNPKQHVTRAEFAHYLKLFFDLKPLTGTTSAQVDPKLFIDISETTPYFEDIKIVLSNQLLQGDQHGQFNPNKRITRLEALVATVRACNFTVTEDIKLPYRNISKRHWGYPYLQKAYANHLIMKSRTFKSRTLITKAELIAMLSRTPLVLAKLNSVF